MKGIVNVFDFVDALPVRAVRMVVIRNSEIESVITPAVVAKTPETDSHGEKGNRSSPTHVDAVGSFDNSSDEDPVSAMTRSWRDSLEAWRIGQALMASCNICMALKDNEDAICTFCRGEESSGDFGLQSLFGLDPIDEEVEDRPPIKPVTVRPTPLRSLDLDAAATPDSSEEPLEKLSTTPQEQEEFDNAQRVAETTLKRTATKKRKADRPLDEECERPSCVPWIGERS